MWSSIGLLAATIGMTVSIPQVVRLLRSSSADGISLPSTVLGVLAGATWLTYGIMQVNPAQLLSNIPGVAGAMAVTVLVARTTGRPLRPAAFAAAAWVAVVLTAGLYGGVAAVGVAAAGLSLVRQVPQLIHSFGSTSLSGISSVSYALSLTSSTLWMAYGFGMQDAPVWACSSLSVLISGTIFLRRVRSGAPSIACHRHVSWRSAAAPVAGFAAVPYRTTFA